LTNSNKSNKDEKSDEHGWQDTTQRYPLDSLLRKYGFTIHSRIRKKDKIISEWSKGKEIYAEIKALKMLDRNLLADAEYQEILHYQGLD